MPSQSRRAAVLHRTTLQANAAYDQPAQLPPNFPPLHLLLGDPQSLPATTHFPALSAPAAKNNPGRRNPFFHSADALQRTSCHDKARVLRISPILTPDVPAPPMCKAASSCPHRMRPREKLFRCVRCPLRSRVTLQFGGRPFETICKYRGRSVAAPARASISR